MPIHLDVPAPGMEFDPHEFTVRGWLWLEDQHSDIAAVEAWTSHFFLGETASLHVRADVNAKYGLPAGTRTAFQINARYHYAAQNSNFDLRLHVRRRDGTQTDALFVSRVGPLPISCDPRALLRVALPPGSRGLEIGAHAQPTLGVHPFYTDSVPDFAGATGRLDFLSDACALPLADAALDYLCCSHVLEHLPDPLAALFEWHRVLGPGGYLYLVVPDQRFTFDAPRATTTTDHLLRDFARAATAATSLEHVDEFIFQTDWSLLHPELPSAEWPHHQAAAQADYLARLARGDSVDIHFHTFTPASLRATLHAIGFIGGPTTDFVIAAEAERYPPERTDGIALLLRRRSPIKELDLAPTCNLVRGPDYSSRLPLVDPVSLRPLPENYLEQFSGRWPDLLPPRHSVPRRPWNPAWRRHLRRRRCQFRMKFSSPFP
jgi:SAM-dependent methyltransferase